MAGIGDKAARRSQASRKGATRSAQSRKCPRCLRLAAMSQRVTHPDGSARRCNYCGHECGISFGETFGYDVTPEPGAKPKDKR
jgi:hypothetical protein